MRTVAISSLPIVASKLYVCGGEGVWSWFCDQLVCVPSGLSVLVSSSWYIRSLSVDFHGYTHLL